MQRLRFSGDGVYKFNYFFLINSGRAQNKVVRTCFSFINSNRVFVCVLQLKVYLVRLHLH